MKFGNREVPVIGQGTWNMEQDSRPACIAALRRGLDLGLTHIDTAELYGAGRVEELVAEAINGRRNEVFLVSKVLPTNASYEGTLTACEQSLKRLKTDRLDCYLLHWPGDFPLEDTLHAFDTLMMEGKILSFGVSNFDEDDLAAAIEISGKRKIVCNQVLYHLEERAIENAVIPYCQKHGVAVVAYSPFGSGHFPGPKTPGGKVLAEVASRHKATPRQVALAFLSRDPGTFVIPKTTDVHHVEDNAGAAKLSLSKADIGAIDAAFPRGLPRRGVPTL